jgi:HlyD family secretion protein
MRRLLPLLLTLVIVGAFAWTLRFLYERSKAKPVVWQTERASIADVVQKTIAAGAIVPREEVTIKPRASGVIEKLLVEPGQLVKSGDLIAKIRIIPDMVTLNNAEARVDSAKLNLAAAEKELRRIQQLRSEQLIAEGDLTQAELQVELGKKELAASKNNVQLIKEGAIRGSGLVSNVVTSTVAGMVIEVPVKLGSSVIEANTFNEGTTIAAVADMSDLIFEGQVDESDVGKLKEGMPVSIAVGALPNERFDGKLEYISPKGIDTDGTIEFQVKAALDIPEGKFLRANYSANADIILERRDQVLTVDEKLLQFDHKRPFVEVRTGPGAFTRRDVKLGLSDGSRAEVLAGVSPEDDIKVPHSDEAEQEGPGGGK